MKSAANVALSILAAAVMLPFALMLFLLLGFNPLPRRDWLLTTLFVGGFAIIGWLTMLRDVPSVEAFTVRIGILLMLTSTLLHATRDRPHG